MTVTPRDLCRFLIFKDKRGKTQVHRNTCEFLGQRGNQSCGCPLRLSYKTVDSYIGKLRSIFHSIGRDGAWDKRLGLGNPASDKLVKDYLRLVTAEQLQARVTPKQATPFFVDKLTQLSQYLEGELARSKSKLDRFILARDQAYFKLTFFSGTAQEILVRLKFRRSFVFQMMMGSYLIISGVRLCRIVTVMSLVFAEIPSRSSVL